MSASTLSNKVESRQWDEETSHETHRHIRDHGHLMPRNPRAPRMSFKSSEPIKSSNHDKTYYIRAPVDLRQNGPIQSSHKVSKDTTSEEDPFAGMNAVVDYQQEIERLKVALARSDPKLKRTTSKHEPSSPASEPFVSAAEQERFIAFMRMWTGGSQRWNNCSRCF
ncbi:hypothetical protein BGW37DRAFT_262464 [Umbelopsis sp. PMI_123]|nr:hypothetical protein BGW37DRAFT_262464 [Umbelopsis sp. PMI_123]